MMKIRKCFSDSIRRSTLAVCIVALLLFSGCATPVGVRHLKPEEEYRKLTANVLSGNTLSAETTQILNRADLAGKYAKEPAQVIASIHDGLPTVKEADRIFALAELSFLHASRGGDRSYFLSTAIYAYAFLFPSDVDLPQFIVPPLEFVFPLNICRRAQSPLAQAVYIPRNCAA
jgi:hypothetical protein